MKKEFCSPCHLPLEGMFTLSVFPELLSCNAEDRRRTTNKGATKNQEG